MKYDLFISYSRKDLDEVNALKKRIEEDIPEIAIWFDLDGIESGDEFKEKIISAIDNSRTILFMASDNSLKSEWTNKEYTYAKNKKKKIVPFILEGVELKSWMLFDFGVQDCINYTDDLQYSKFIKSLSVETGRRMKSQYSVRFIADYEIIKEYVLNIGEAIVLPDAPVKEGYSFKSWGNVPSTMPARDLEFNAEFTVNKYSVTFEIDGIYNTKLQGFGSPIEQPEKPTKEGYAFCGWDKPILSGVPAHDVQYKAIFRPNKYKVRFIADNNVIKEEELDFGTLIDAPQPPKKTGHLFISWGNVPETVPARDAEFVAEYVRCKYKVTYRIMKEDIVKEYEYGAVLLPKPTEPKIEGMAFLGWDKDLAATMPAHDLVYIAQFTPKKYKVTFIVDGKSTVREFEYGSIIIEPNVDVKEGFECNWDKKVPNKMPAEDLAFISVIRPKKFHVIFNINSKTETKELEYGERIYEPSTYKYGYNFVGWNPKLPKKMPAHNVVVTALYEADKKIQFERYISDKKYELNHTINKKKSDLGWWWKYECSGFRKRLIESFAYPAAVLSFLICCFIPVIFEMIICLITSNGTKLLFGHSKGDEFLELFYDGAFVSHLLSNSGDFFLYLLMNWAIWLICPIGWFLVPWSFGKSKKIKKWVEERASYLMQDKEPSLYTIPIMIILCYLMTIVGISICFF